MTKAHKARIMLSLYVTTLHVGDNITSPPHPPHLKT